MEMRGSCDPGGIRWIAAGDIPNSLLSSKKCPSSCCARASCMRHAPVLFFGNLARLCILPILSGNICSPPFVLLYLPCFCFLMLSLELCRRSSGFFLSSRPRTGLVTIAYLVCILLGMVKARLVNVNNTDTPTRTHICALFPWCWHPKRRALLHTGTMRQQQRGPQELPGLEFFNFRLDLRKQMMCEPGGFHVD